jgi:opacity protein-like surface antigen
MLAPIGDSSRSTLRTNRDVASLLHSAVAFSEAATEAPRIGTRRFQTLDEIRGGIASATRSVGTQEEVMRALMIAAAVTLLTAAPLFARGSGGQDASGFVTGLGGFATSVGNTTGDVLVEGGVRIAPHVMAFGNIGRFGNLQADLQPTLDTTTAALAANQGLSVIGGGSLPASYFVGGLRVEVPTRGRVMPYVLGGVGVARLNPTAQFTFSSGIMPDGSMPAVGTDVTTAMTSAGFFTAPPASTAPMFTLGGGVQVPVAPHWVVDAAYRYSRIAADSTLSAAPLNANGMTFGFGYRF